MTKSAPKIFLLGLALCFSLTSPIAHAAPMKVKFDCYLQGSNLNCSELKSQYFSGFLGVAEAVETAAEADWVLTLRSLRIDRSIRYSASYSATNEIGPMDSTITISDTRPIEDAKRDLLTHLHQCSAPYLPLMAGPAQVTRDGVVMLFRDRFATPGSTTDLNTNWFNSSSIQGTLTTGDVSKTDATASDTVTYSDPNLKWQTKGSARYQKISVKSDDGQEISADVFTFNGESITAYTIEGHWSVAAIVGVNHDPTSNIQVGAFADAGLEWNLVPFLRTGESTVAVRYRAGYTNQSYESENLLNHDHESFLTHSLTAVINWHFDRFDISTGIGAGSILDRIAYSQVGGGAHLDFRVTGDITMSADFGFTLRNKIINEPANPESTNPYYSLLSNGNFSGFTTTSVLKITYSLGNSLGISQDNRWK